MYLAAGGVARIGLVDFDVVDASNLQRQETYSAEDVGRPKLQVAILAWADRIDRSVPKY